MVEDCDLPRARQMVREHHYAGGASNTATHLHGLYRRDDFSLHGVAWWIPPTRGAAASFWEDPEEVLCLSRLVILPGTPKNAATFLLMNSVKRIDPVWRCLITYADTWRGHSGGIYRVSGWEEYGLTKPERTYVIDGRMVARKAGPHTRTHAEMLALGAECVGSFAKYRFRLVRRARGRRTPQQNLLALSE